MVLHISISVFGESVDVSSIRYYREKTGFILLGVVQFTVWHLEIVKTFQRQTLTLYMNSMRVI